MKISQKDFNEEMSRYLDRVNTSSSGPILSRISFFKGFVDEDVPEMEENRVHIEYERPSFMRRVVTWRRKVKIGEVEEGLDKTEKEDLEELETEIEALEEEESELEQMEEEVEEQKQGLMSSLFSKINVFKGRQSDSVDMDAYEEEVPPPELDEDVKDVLRIAHLWLEKLPSRHKKAFKDSKDFENYKSILLKYGLVREK